MNVTHYFNTPESSVLKFVGYDQDEQALTVSFVNGSQSTYLDVGVDEFADFAASTSRGQYYNYYIKGEFSTDSEAVVMLAPSVVDVTDTPPGEIARLFGSPVLVTESDDVTESDNALEVALSGGRFQLDFGNPDGRFFNEAFTREEAKAVYDALKPFGWQVSLDD